MTRTEIDTILEIAYERAKLLKQKNENGKQKIIDDAIRDLKKTKVEQSLIARKLVEKLANKETGMHRATIYRRVKAEFKSKTRGAGRKGKLSLSHLRQTQTGTVPTTSFPPIIPPQAIALTTSTSSASYSQTFTAAEEKESEAEQESQKTKWPEQDPIAALKLSSERNNLINRLIYEISGMDEAERREFAIRLAKGKMFTSSLADYCRDHIFDLVSRIPDIQMELSLSISQTLEAILKKYTDLLYDRRMKTKNGMGSV